LRKIIGGIVIVLGIIAGILLFSAGLAMNSHGAELTKLQSEAGNTIAEAYYQEIGNYGIATSQAYYGFGLAVIAISLALGGRLFITNSSLKPTTPTNSIPPQETKILS